MSFYRSVDCLQNVSCPRVFQTKIQHRHVAPVSHLLTLLTRRERLDIILVRPCRNVRCVSKTAYLWVLLVQSIEPQNGCGETQQRHAHILML